MDQFQDQFPIIIIIIIIVWEQIYKRVWMFSVIQVTFTPQWVSRGSTGLASMMVFHLFLNSIKSPVKTKVIMLESTLSLDWLFSETLLSISVSVNSPQRPPLCSSCSTSSCCFSLFHAEIRSNCQEWIIATTQIRKLDQALLQKDGRKAWMTTRGCPPLLFQEWTTFCPERLHKVKTNNKTSLHFLAGAVF